MRTVSPDRACIDYWQNYGNGKQVLKSHFGIRVWPDRCCAITNVAAANPSLFGEPHPIPWDLASVANHSLSNVVSEHMNHHPESDLIAVLTGKKPFHEALG